MLLKKLVLDNYKTYYGIQEIDLYIPSDLREEGKNIILLGGLNGAGKTTILKAILYVLFGKRGMNESEYKQLSANIINNTFFDEGGRQCSVTLIIETDSGEEWTLKVKWYVDKMKRVSHEERDLAVSRPESFAKKKARIDNLEAFNRFIDKIIPYHAAPFFIFDGEEIKEIILRQNSHEMKQAIHKISGMDAYEQLINDLYSLKTNLENRLASSVSHSKVKNYQFDLKKLNDSLETEEARKDKVIKKIKEFEELLENTKEIRNKKVLQNSHSRESIIKKQSRLETQAKQVKEELNNYYHEHILSIILGSKIKNLQKQLRKEKDINKKRILQQSQLDPYNKFMEELLSHNIKPPLSKEQLSQIQEIGKNIWIKENNIDDQTEEFKEVHDVSNKEYNIIMNYPIKDKHFVINLINKLEKLNLEIQETENEIRSAPETVNVDEENKKIDSLSKTIGEYNLRLRAINKRIITAETEKTNLTNKLTRLSGKNEDVESLKKQRSLLEKTIETMEKYINDVTNMKAEFIKEEFAAMLNKLFRKQDEFGKIEFDINSYTIRLFNDRMQEISIQDRSAGEMQMISSSLIWALTRASDLSLPIVVDTPLGRLDSYHRNHLINYYYKELSEQVIILSTDTEITEEYIKLMESHSYKQYMLDYDEEKKYTIIKDGYFQFV